MRGRTRNELRELYDLRRQSQYCSSLYGPTHEILNAICFLEDPRKYAVDEAILHFTNIATAKANILNYSQYA